MSTPPGYPDELPRRKRVSERLPAWSDEAAVRSWVFTPVPVWSFHSDFFSRDLATVQRVYEWMLAEGWKKVP